MKNNMNKYKAAQTAIKVLPFAALVLLFGIFLAVVSAKGYRLDMYLQIVFNEGVVLAVVATGAIFIYTLGTFDISLGAATLFSATMGVVTYNTTQNVVLMILAIFVSGVACSLVNSLLASVFHIPAFVTTVAMMSVLSAIASQIVTTKGGALGGISIPGVVVKPFDNIVFKIVVLAVFFIISYFVFNLTKVGRRQKFIGGNPVCAALTEIYHYCFRNGRPGRRAWSVSYSGLYTICNNHYGLQHWYEYFYCNCIWRNAYFRRSTFQNLCGTGWRFFLYPAQ